MARWVVGVVSALLGDHRSLLWTRPPDWLRAAAQAGVVSAFDLAAVGSGSGNVVVPSDRLGLRTALVEAELFGGTCINRGCIPSKMLVHTADLADNVREAALFGVDAAIVEIEWSAIRN